MAPHAELQNYVLGWVEVEFNLESARSTVAQILPLTEDTDPRRSIGINEKSWRPMHVLRIDARAWSLQSYSLTYCVSDIGNHGNSVVLGPDQVSASRNRITNLYKC